MPHIVAAVPKIPLRAAIAAATAAIHNIALYRSIGGGCSSLPSQG
jgi:hypothetical protein